MTKPEFSGLDSVAWSDLFHAYGPADDMPDLIRGLVSSDAEEREGALDACFGCIYHQGSRYPASVATVPFLLEALETPGTPGKRRILDLLGNLAVGWPWDMGFRGFEPEQDFGGDPFPEGWQKRRTFDYDERVVERACYLAVAKGCSSYRKLLYDSDPHTRLSASWLLAWFPAHGWAAVPDLQRVAADPEQHELLRASAWLAISHMGADSGDLEASLPAQASKGRVSFLTAVSALDKARRFIVAGQDVPDAEATALQEALERGVATPAADSLFDPYEDWPWGAIDKLVREAVDATAKGSRLELLLQRLPAATRKGQGVEVARSLLEGAFGPIPEGVTTGIRPDRVIESDDWAPFQRKVLQSLVDCEGLWPEVAYWVHVALDLVFDPTREELSFALAPKPKATKKKSPKKSGAPAYEDLSANELGRLVSDLASSDPDTRAKAARALGRGGRSLDLPALERLADLTIQDADRDVRCGAAWAISRAGKTAAPLIPRLMEALGEGGDAGQFDVPSALSGLGLLAMEPVVEALRGEESTRTFAAARAFPGVHDVGLDPILSALKDEHPRVREWAGISLQRALERQGFSETKRVVPCLLEALTDPEEKVRERVVWALQKSGPEGLPAIVEAAQAATGEHLSHLLQIIQATGGGNGAAVLPVLRHALTSAEVEARRETVNAIGNLDDCPVESVAALVPALADSEAAVRKLAANALGHLGSLAGSCPSEAAGLFADPDPEVRQAIATALGRIGQGATADAISSLGSALSDECESVQRESAWALGRLGQEAVPELLNCLERSAARFEVIWVLGLLEPSSGEARRLLKNVAESSDAESGIAAWALSRVSED